MKIDKAVNLIEGLAKGRSLHFMPDEQRALKLGVEALKHVQLKRSKHYIEPLLPGETLEGE